MKPIFVMKMRFRRKQSVQNVQKCKKKKYHLQQKVNITRLKNENIKKGNHEDDKDETSEHPHYVSLLDYP